MLSRSEIVFTVKMIKSTTSFILGKTIIIRSMDGITQRRS